MEAIEKQTNEQEVIAKLNERLGQLKAASEIAVTDQESLVRSAAVKLDLEAYVRAVENAFEPELAPAEEKVRRLKISMSSLLQPAKQWLTALVNRQREWAAEEKRKAALEKQREQEKINAAARAKADAERREAERLAEERRKEQFAEAERQRREREKELEAQRKAGEINKREMEKQKKAEAERQQQLAKQREKEEADAKALAAKQAEETVANAPTVTVQPNIPKVAGVKNQTYWKFRIVDETKVPRMYCVPDEAAIGRTVRTLKDKARTEALIPGIEVFSEG